ncbi:hypothetical protein GCM10009530_54710 [Microbispora corallina]
MDEHILPTVYRDEAVALVRVKPFDGALRHFPTPLAGLGTTHKKPPVSSIVFDHTRVKA